MDQGQAGTAAVPCAGPEESVDGNAVGLPDLQRAVLDPPKQATHNTSSYLRSSKRRAKTAEALFRGSKSPIQKTHTHFTATSSNGFLHGFLASTPYAREPRFIGTYRLLS
jgi:hypothetical protein